MADLGREIRRGFRLRNDLAAVDGIDGPVAIAMKDDGWYDTFASATRYADYPILGFSALPEMKIELINRPNQPSTAAGEISTIPVPAAIANAVFDATGKRLPFTPERVRALLTSNSDPSARCVAP
jgi:hypothetical protein